MKTFTEAHPPLVPTALALVAMLAFLLGTTGHSRAQCCAQIAGDWDVEEEVHTKTYVDGVLEDEDTQSGGGNVTISQNGCSFSFYSEVPDPNHAGTARVLRRGSVSGDRITFSGQAAIVPAGVSCSQNMITSQGRISPTFSGATIQLNTTGTVLCSAQGHTIRVEIVGSATFTAFREIAMPPTVAVEPATQSVLTEVGPDGARLPGPEVAFSAQVNGPGTVSFRWFHNGTVLPGATNAVLTILDAHSADAGSYTVEARVGSCTARGSATLTVNGATSADRTPPVLLVIDPAGPVIRVATASNVFLMRGTARDSRGLAGVFLQSGDGPFAAVEGGSNWSALVSLAPGSNRFRLKAVDEAGNTSSPLTRTIVFVVTSPLTLSASPGGKVFGATNQQRLEVGRGYTLTAIPAAGYLFSNWTGGMISPANPLRFVMSSNLVLQANFVANPFLPLAGVFHGLFHEPDMARHGSSGAFKATVLGSGAYSGTLMTGSRRRAVTGRFGLDGKATNIVAGVGTNAWAVELSLQFDGSETITGRVKDVAWSSDLQANRAVFSAVANPATNFAGRFTMLVPGGTNGSALEPAGDGFSAVTISRGGAATLKATLADGVPAVVVVPVSKRGDVPFYVSLYGGAGSALSWLRVRPSAETDLDGELAWFRPVRATPPLYTNGFTLISRVAGSVYTPFGTNRLFSAEVASVVFRDGGLNESFTNEIALGPNGRATNRSLNALTLRAVSATGLLNGTVTPPAGGKALAWKGALLQRQQFCAGFFLNGTQSGEVGVFP